MQDPRQALVRASFGLDLIVRTGSYGLSFSSLRVVVHPRSLCVLLASLALTLVASGCGGASPETRFTETQTALYGTRTPTPLEAARAAIAEGTVTKLGPEIAASLTAEATLSIATPTSPDEATPGVENERR